MNVQSQLLCVGVLDIITIYKLFKRLFLWQEEHLLVENCLNVFAQLNEIQNFIDGWTWIKFLLEDQVCLFNDKFFISSDQVNHKTCLLRKLIKSHQNISIVDHFIEFWQNYIFVFLKHDFL